jgi:hypothetical protein
MGDAAWPTETQYESPTFLEGARMASMVEWAA